MNNFCRHICLLLVLLLTTQCTSTRWVVQDPYSIDESEDPEITGTNYTFILNDSPDAENPYFSVYLHEIQEQQFTQRVLVERTVQSYRPSFRFWALGLTGASMAFYAGNTDRLTASVSENQTLAFNAIGSLLTLVTLTNLKPADDPIQTGETKLLRKSGEIIIPDTTGRISSNDTEFRIEAFYDNERIFEQDYTEIESDGLHLNLARLFDDRQVTGVHPGTMELLFRNENSERRFEIPVRSFMRPVFQITSPVAELRNYPVYDDRPPLTVLGAGSELLLLDESSDQWVEVQFGGSRVYIARESGEISWEPDQAAEEAEIVRVEEVPFGSISVEYSVPVLKEENQYDKALLLSNHRNNQVGLRRYLERDHRLLELYFREAFRIEQDRIFSGHLTDERTADMIIDDLSVESVSTLHLYITGFAEIDREEEPQVRLIHVDEQGIESRIDLRKMLSEIASHESARLVIFMDLNFITDSVESNFYSANSNSNLLGNLASAVTQIHPNAAVIFSNRPGQVSGLYESVRFENKYHHIFPYFLSQGLQQRRTRLSDLVRHITNQVEYTSRRLHDRPQTVTAFGNLSINLAE